MKSSQPSLLSLIAEDLWRHKCLALLFIFTLLSALTLVYTTHKTRLQVNRMDELMAIRDRLNIEWRHLNNEKSSKTEHSEIQYLAKKKLGMVFTHPENEKVIIQP